MIARGADQRDHVTGHLAQIARLAPRRLGLAGGQEALQVRLGDGQLPQGHRQAVLIDAGAMSLVKLHGNPRR